MRWMFLPLLTGCTAARGTIRMVEAEQDFALAQSAEAEDLAVYAWTMAESYMHKSREEYAHADYEAAEALAAKASEWSVKAKSIAESMEIRPLEEATGVIPETVQPPTEPEPFIDNREDDLVVPSVDDPDEDPAEGLDIEDADPDIDDILFEDEEDDDEGDW